MKFTISTEGFIGYQKKFWDLPNYIKILVGGYGSGKTYIGALRLIYLSYLNHGLPVMYISPSYKMAKRTIIPSLKGIMNRSGITYTHNKTENEIKILNWDGKIWIGSGDDPQGLLGQELAAVGIDEPFIQSKEVFDIAISRIRHPEAPQREMFLTGTPESLNWGYDIAINNEDQYDVGVVFGSTLENPHLPAQYKESLLETYSQEMIDAYVYGKFVNLQKGRVYKNFDRSIHVKERDDLKKLIKYDDIHIGMDFNVNPMCACAFVKIGETIHVFKEWYLNNANTYDMSEIIRKEFPKSFVYPDATGASRKTSSAKSDHQILRDSFFKIKAKRRNPPVRDRVNAVNNLLLIRDGKSRFSVENCPKLVSDLERVVWKSGDIDKSDSALTHTSDALGYGIHFLFPIVARKASVIRW